MQVPSSKAGPWGAPKGETVHFELCTFVDLNTAEPKSEMVNAGTILK